MASMPLKEKKMTINIVEDLDKLIGLNVRDVIEYIESKLSCDYDIVAKDNILGEYGYSCGVKYHKPFSGTMYIDIKCAHLKRGATLNFSKKTNLLESYRISCNK